MYLLFCTQIGMNPRRTGTWDESEVFYVIARPTHMLACGSLKSWTLLRRPGATTAGQNTTLLLLNYSLWVGRYLGSDQTYPDASWYQTLIPKKRRPTYPHTQCQFHFTVYTPPLSIRHCVCIQQEHTWHYITAPPNSPTAHRTNMPKNATWCTAQHVVLSFGLY